MRLGGRASAPLNPVTSQHKPRTASPLPVLADGPGAAGSHAPDGFGIPRDLPPGVTASATGPVFHSERVTGPAGAYGWIAGAALSLAIVAGGVLLVSRGGWLIALGALLAIAGVALAVTTVSFRQLTIVVDREGVAWSFGPLFRRRYAHAEVTMFRSRDFAFRKSGGWGIGRAHDGVDVYQVWGANGTALDIVVNRGGVAKHYLVSTVVPDVVCAALVRASAAAGRTVTSSASKA